MNADTFKALLRKHVVPMFAGTSLKDPVRIEVVDHVHFDDEDASTMNLSWDPSGPAQWLLQRYQGFSSSEVGLVRNILRNLREAQSLEGSYLFDEMVRPAIRRAVAQQVSPQCVEVAVALLLRLEQWAQETYEGRPISAAIGLDPALRENTVAADDVFDEGVGIVMANGLETFLVVGADGNVCGYEPFADVGVNTKVLSPLRFARLADWAVGDRAGFALTRNGEILVFARGELCYARRHGVWLHFPHHAIIERIRHNHLIEHEVARAVYLTILDVSFARSGGGLAIVLKKNEVLLRESAIISQHDRPSADSTKGRFLEVVVRNRPFHKLDRRLRQDLAAIDGSTILMSDGRILAVGAIIQINAGSEGGGRLAAARTLAEYGFGIKISSDGEVQGFRQFSGADNADSRLGRSFRFG